MAELSSKQSSPELLRIAGEPDGEVRGAPLPPPGSQAKPPTAPPAGFIMTNAPPARPPRHGTLLVGLVLILAGVFLALLPPASWKSLFSEDAPAGAVGAAPASPSPTPTAMQDWFSRESLATDNARWIISGLIVLAGLSFLRARALAVVITAAMFALTAYCCDELSNHAFSRAVSAIFADGAARYVLPLVAAAFGYLVHTLPNQEKLSLRGVFGLVLTAIAALGTVRGWYDWTSVAARIGPDAEKVLAEWRTECTWATVLILTAIGVASSRTRPLHFLIALMLAALAWHCVSTGLVEVRSFTDLAKDGRVLSVEVSSYHNVDIWRWVVAGEMTLLAVILLHLAIGLGGLNIAFAIVWMVVGLAIYDSVGSMSIVRTASEAAGESGAARRAGGGAPAGADPLANWGLPLAAPPAMPPRPQTAPPADADSKGASTVPQSARPVEVQDLEAARNRAMQSIQREQLKATIVREVTPLVWMFLIAILAGAFGVTGVAMMTGREGVRVFVLCGLWLAVGIAVSALWSVWPKNSESWQGVVAAFRYSRYHTWAIWLAFLVTAALAGCWVLRKDSRVDAWVQASAAAILLGTGLTFGAVAILIRYGGFPSLPTWTYIVIAVGQSSLMWALLMQQNIAARRARRLR
ncbi:MAG: hypothetical protein DCC65_17940 [Planctomycetota bacterium]|nr:MAG: hypothetical protein DCC65_17940 [Planctomycetota bacterium]